MFHICFINPLLYSLEEFIAPLYKKIFTCHCDIYIQHVYNMTLTVRSDATFLM
jgi:hypothetical protein